MENYKVQLKIAKENVPSLLMNFDEGQVWEKVKGLVKDGKVELTVFERDEDYNGFDFPAEVTKMNADWDHNFKGSLFLESELLLKESETDPESVFKMFSDMLEKSNFEIYSYYLNGDLYQSYGYIDDEFLMFDEEQSENISEIERKEREQLDMFKKRRKSK